MAKWIKFEVTFSSSKKTKRWWVINIEGQGKIGEIKWFGKWRKYGFFPDRDTVFEPVCMRDIANFIEDETKLHYLKLKENKCKGTSS